jgi:FkbM family methyltransferase
VKRDRWQGIILEPQSHNFETYLERVYRKNPGIHTLCAAIGEEDGYRKLYKIGFTQMRWASGLASFDREQIIKAFSSGRVKEFCDRYGIEIPASPDEQIVSEDVRVVRPETLLARYRISEIDLLILDTEGYDYRVLKMFDIGRTQPGAIIFENMHLSDQDLQDCGSMLHLQGYALRTYGHNTLAMKHPPAAFLDFFETG